MRKIGRYEVGIIVSDRFRLDGGAMFGSVPKTLWSRNIPGDDKNRIQLCCREMLIKDGNHTILVDCGMGDKWDDKSRDIFAIEPQLSLHEEVRGVTDLLLTHLHFDHSGGVSKRDENKNLSLTFPKATHYISKENLERAEHPGIRERASYLDENVSILKTSNLKITSDGEELFPGITLHQAHGHTKGLQWILIRDEKETIAYPSDLIPTAHHVSIPYVMGYDLCAETSMRKRKISCKPRLRKIGS